MERVNPRRICVVITARPSYSRIKSALQAMQAHPGIELKVVVGASALLDRYGRTAEVIRNDGIEIAAQVYMVLEGENPTAMAKTTGLGVLELATVFGNLDPDIVVTVADRYETLATAVAAAYMNIPLVHVQGGEVSGSIDEKVRHAVTKLADLHLVATQRAAQRVIAMGEHPDAVLVTGCPSIDLAAEVQMDPAIDFDPIERYQGVGAELDLTRGYLVVLQHPVTTEHERAREHALETLLAIQALGIPTLWFWPNVDAGSDGTARAIRSFRESERPANIHFIKSMEPRDFLRLLVKAQCLVGNSSVGIRECSYLGVPVVNIGQRQRGRERGANVIDVAHGRDEILLGIKAQSSHGPFATDPLYGDGTAGRQIAAILSRASIDIDKRLTY